MPPPPKKKRKKKRGEKKRGGKRGGKKRGKKEDFAAARVAIISDRKQTFFKGGLTPLNNKTTLTHQSNTP